MGCVVLHVTLYVALLTHSGAGFLVPCAGLQLCVPPIESGGQFSVGVQEECLRVLGTFEEQVRPLHTSAFE